MLTSPRSSSDALAPVLAQLIYRCLEDLGSTKAALYLAEPESQGFVLASHYGWPRTQPPPDRLPPLDPLLVLISRERRSFAVNDARTFRELVPFSQGPANPRFYISPIYDHGYWKGVLIQRDPSKGGSFSAEQHEAGTQAICVEIARALRAAERAQAPAPEPPPPPPPAEMPVTPREEIPPIRVAAPPSAAMVQLETPMPAPEGSALEQVQVSSSGEASITAIAMPQPIILSEPPPFPDPGDPFRDLPQAESDAFIPEQQTFFWEAANLLCQMVPTTAAALWLNDTEEARPLLIYSRFPLSTDLKHQIIAQTMAQVPHVQREDLRLLTKSEWYERDPLAGHFLTLLPVLLEEEVGGDNLLMLFRLEDQPFSMHEQDMIRQVARMLGFYLQEVRLHERYHQAFLSVSHRILASTEGRIPAMKVHSVNTAEWSRDLARKLDLGTAEVEAVSISAILHDVGTLLLDYRILDKPRLTEEELAKVRTHPLLASTFLKDLYFPFDVLHIIRHHHEHWDGSGYPDGLQGEAIPIGSRIIHLVEAFEMMLSETPYRPARTVAEAVAELKRLAGHQFDPYLVAQFIPLIQART